MTQNFDRNSANNNKVDGVFIDGLFLEAARWRNDSLDEPAPKTPYSPLPVLHMTAEKFKKTSDMENQQKYNCPIYKYKQRTDKYLITRVKLACGDGEKKPAYWRKRGVALLCSKED